MEVAMIELHLAQAETHVAEGDAHLVRQREIVAELERDGHNEAPKSGRELLATFEQTQQSHLDDRTASALNWPPAGDFNCHTPPHRLVRSM
jgi:hypothetical protein